MSSNVSWDDALCKKYSAINLCLYFFGLPARVLNEGRAAPDSYRDALSLLAISRTCQVGLKHAVPSRPQVHQSIYLYTSAKSVTKFLLTTDCKDFHGSISIGNFLLPDTQLRENISQQIIHRLRQ
jgi:hypothetical protein